MAKIQATWPYDGAGVATLTLEADGKVIDQLSAVLPMVGAPPYVEHLEEHGAAALVEAMARSSRVQEMARWKAQPRTPQVAEPAEPQR